MKYHDLHSNMDLLKSYTDTIMKKQKVDLHSNMDLLKLIRMIIKSLLKFIYIPIWIYSNSKKLNRNFRKLKIYIPIWIYSN